MFDNLLYLGSEALDVVDHSRPGIVFSASGILSVIVDSPTFDSSR